tara:strand:+ start:1490 stop:2704 length:1215 start_codon:yes stop_codon:yes gene_type:complete
MLQFYFILKNIFFIFVFIFIQSNYIFADKLLVNCGGDFNTFLRNIGEVAINQGIDKNDVFLVLKNTQRSKKVLSFDRKQSTFRLSFTDFSKKAINSYRLKNGKKNIEKYRDLFLFTKSKYGIPPEVITAFWAMETDFGAVQGNFHTISALATLAHDCRRPEMFQQEYIAAIHLFSKGVIDLKTTGAWAGEVGQVQMLPSDILRFGSDGNKDGIIDLKKSPEDSIFTAAALISELGWKPNQPWIEEVIINDINFPWQEAGFGRNRTVSSWKKLGIISRNKKFMASDDTMATLLLPQGLKGPKFLAYPNYDIYLKWNDSFIYTVTAAHLASRLGGQKKFLSSKPEEILSVEEMLKLQKILQSMGYDVGKVDGILGRKTRQSVRSIQIKLGLPADSWPTADLFSTLN